jgi:tetratricopeptide (TPR) repeat protein
MVAVRPALFAALVILGTGPNVRSEWGQAPSEAQTLPQINLESYPAVSRAPIEHALKAAKARPEDADAVGQLGMTLHAWEQFETAAAVYARARTLSPRFDWFYLGGLIETRLAHHREAAHLLEEAIARSPESLPARLAFADALFEAGDIAKAHTAYAALTTGASEPHARYGLGRCAAASGDDNAAIIELNGAVRLFPAFGAAWYARGMALRRLGRIEEARDSLAKAQQYGTRWPAVDDQLMARVRALRDDAAARSDRAFALQARGETARAIEEYEGAVASDPKWARARVNLIAIYCRDRQWAKAEEHFKAMSDLGLRVAEGYYNFAVCLAAQGETARAASEFHTAVEINPQYPQAWMALGQLVERDGRLDEAEASYRKAAEQAPDDPTAQFNLARMLLARHESQQAIAVLERIASRDDPNRARVLFALATAHVQAGDLAAARRFAVEARDVARSSGQVDLAAAIERDLAKLP